MVYKADKLRLRKLLMDAISLLCKNGLPVQSAFRIEATIGITLSEDEVVLVSFREVVQPDGLLVPQAASEDEASDEASGDVLSDGEDFSYSAEDGKQIEGKISSNSLSQATSKVGEEVNETWNGTALTDSSSSVRKDSSVDATTKCPPEISEVFSYDDPSQVVECSSLEQVSRGCTGNSSNTRVPIQIKDEVMDDEECAFVKMEDGADTFDSLGQDNSWMYQVYNDVGAYGTSNNELMQNYSPEDAPLHNSQSWSAVSHGGARSSQSRRSSFVSASGSIPRSNTNPSGASHSQGRNVARTLQSLCKTLADQAYSSAPGEPVFCHICGARLSSHATLVKHIKGTHLAMSTCQCDICGQSFKWTMQLCRHRKRYHSNISAE